MVFCGACGCALTGQTNKNGEAYYRHTGRYRGKECSAKGWIPAATLEVAVISQLFECFGNPVESENEKEKENNCTRGTDKVQTPL